MPPKKLSVIKLKWGKRNQSRHNLQSHIHTNWNIQKLHLKHRFLICWLLPKADSPVLTYTWQIVLITHRIAYPVFKTKHSFEGSTVSAICCKQQLLVTVSNALPWQIQINVTKMGVRKTKTHKYKWCSIVMELFYHNNIFKSNLTIPEQPRDY